MFNIFTHCIVFELCVVEKKKEREKKERKKMEKIEIFMFSFLDLAKG